MAAADSLADGDYTTRVDANGSATVRPVARSFNTMAGRLEQADQQRRQLLADLGHELRTPLTVVRGEIEAMLDGVHDPDQTNLELLLEEVTVMERLIEDLGRSASPKPERSRFIPNRRTSPSSWQTSRMHIAALPPPPVIKFICAKGRIWTMWYSIPFGFEKWWRTSWSTRCAPCPTSSRWR